MKWVFKTKLNPDRSIFKYKVRLVVKGFSKVVGVDYGDTFAPKQTDTIRLLLAISGQLGWIVHHLNVKYASLNGFLIDEIYVQQLIGFESAGNDHKVYRLNKFLYGLKQAPRAWYNRIGNHPRQLGFTRSEYEAILYSKEGGDGHKLIVSLYVDDMLVTSNSCNSIE